MQVAGDWPLLDNGPSDDYPPVSDLELDCH